MLNLLLNLSYILVFITIFAFIFNDQLDLITQIIILELILLAIAILFISYSSLFDDIIGSTISLYILPLAGAESAIALALLVTYYPQRSTLNITLWTL